MKHYCRIFVASLFFCSAGIATARPHAASPACPDLSSLKASAAVNINRNPKQLAADKLVAEAQAITRTMSNVSVAKAISLYEQAIQIDRKNARAHLLLARAHISSQRYLSGW